MNKFSSRVGSDKNGSPCQSWMSLKKDAFIFLRNKLIFCKHWKSRKYLSQKTSIHCGFISIALFDFLCEPAMLATGHRDIFIIVLVQGQTLPKYRFFTWTWTMHKTVLATSLDLKYNSYVTLSYVLHYPLYLVTVFCLNILYLSFSGHHSFNSGCLADL